MTLRRSVDVWRWLDRAATLVMIGTGVVVLWTVFHRRPVRQDRETPLPTEPVSMADMALKGDAAAKAVLVVYSDFECPYCSQFAREVMPALEEKYVQPGMLRIGFRHFPLEQVHQFALPAAAAAECARLENRFWQMHDALFSGPIVSQATLTQVARQVGVASPGYAECVGGRGQARARSDAEAAGGLGLDSTPSFLVGRANDAGGLAVRKVIRGLPTIPQLSTVIDQVIGEK